jgi:hypothetical protein
MIEQQFFVRGCVMGLFVAAAACSKGPSTTVDPDHVAARMPSITHAEPRGSADLRTPDVDLDLKDPAQDYVGRYVRATKRYGDDAACARFEKSEAHGSERSVVVRGRASCGSGNTRDVFLVDVASDRLSLAPESNGKPLAAWPDGSATNEVARDVQSFEGVKSWSSPIVERMTELGLSPYRMDVYGRGTYRVFALAGWTEPVSKDAPREQQRAIAKQLCAANGESFGLVGGGERHEIARVRCPEGTTEWESLRAMGASAR